MPRCRVVRPEVVRLHMSDGDWIDVKQELNAGEYDNQLRALAARERFARILAYVTGWSLIGPDNKPVPYDLDYPEDDRRAAIGAQDKRTIREIYAVLDRHEAAEEAAFEAKKKMRDGAQGSSAILPSGEQQA